MGSLRFSFDNTDLYFHFQASYTSSTLFALFQVTLALLERGADVHLQDRYLHESLLDFCLDFC